MGRPAPASSCFNPPPRWSGKYRPYGILFSLVEPSQIYILSDTVNAASFADSVGRPKAKTLSASSGL